MSNALKFLAALGGVSGGGGGGTSSVIDSGSAEGSGAVSVAIDYVAGDVVVLLCSNRAAESWTTTTTWLTNATDVIGGDGCSGQVWAGTATSSGSSVNITAADSSTYPSAYAAVTIDRECTVTAVSAKGASTTPNPPSLATVVGDLVLAMATSDNNNKITGYPSGYTLDVNSAGANSSSAITHTVATGTTTDPGTFTQSNSANWTAFTVGVTPI